MTELESRGRPDRNGNKATKGTTRADWLKLLHTVAIEELFEVEEPHLDCCLVTWGIAPEFMRGIKDSACQRAVKTRVREDFEEPDFWGDWVEEWVLTEAASKRITDCVQARNPLNASGRNRTTSAIYEAASRVSTAPKLAREFLTANSPCAFFARVARNCEKEASTHGRRRSKDECDPRLLLLRMIERWLKAARAQGEQVAKQIQNEDQDAKPTQKESVATWISTQDEELLADPWHQSSLEKFCRDTLPKAEVDLVLSMQKITLKPMAGRARLASKVDPTALANALRSAVQKLKFALQVSDVSLLTDQKAVSQQGSDQDQFRLSEQIAFDRALAGIQDGRVGEMRKRTAVLLWLYGHIAQVGDEKKPNSSPAESTLTDSAVGKVFGKSQATAYRWRVEGLKEFREALCYWASRDPELSDIHVVPEFSYSPPSVERIYRLAVMIGITSRLPSSRTGVEFVRRAVALEHWWVNRQFNQALSNPKWKIPRLKESSQTLGSREKSIADLLKEAHADWQHIWNWLEGDGGVAHRFPALSDWLTEVREELVTLDRSSPPNVADLIELELT